jgi:hypothetical protein
MPKHPVASHDADGVLRLLRTHHLKHLHVRARGDVLTIESGPTRHAFPHARLRRESVHLWRLEMPTHSGRWQRTPHRGLRDDLIQLLVEVYAWTLQPL